MLNKTQRTIIQRDYTDRLRHLTILYIDTVKGFYHDSVCCLSFLKHICLLIVECFLCLSYADTYSAPPSKNKYHPVPYVITMAKAYGNIKDDKQLIGTPPTDGPTAAPPTFTCERTTEIDHKALTSFVLSSRTSWCPPRLGDNPTREERMQFCRLEAAGVVFLEEKRREEGEMVVGARVPKEKIEDAIFDIFAAEVCLCVCTRVVCVCVCVCVCDSTGTT